MTSIGLATEWYAIDGKTLKDFLCSACRVFRVDLYRGERQRFCTVCACNLMYARAA